MLLLKILLHVIFTGQRHRVSCGFSSSYREAPSLSGVLGARPVLHTQDLRPRGSAEEQEALALGER